MLLYIRVDFYGRLCDEGTGGGALFHFSVAVEPIFIAYARCYVLHTSTIR